MPVGWLVFAWHFVHFLTEHALVVITYISIAMIWQYVLIHFIVVVIIVIINAATKIALLQRITAPALCGKVMTHLQ